MNKQDKIKKVMREFKDSKLYVRRIGYDLQSIIGLI